tara:strand:- start:114 stop:629 length:516 start_codon:yes stop_codon:yes gene_type:complete
MNKTLKIFILIALGAFLFYSDFIRDYVFKNLEYQIHYLSFFSSEGLPMAGNYTDSWMEKSLEGKSIASLSNLKWLFTLVFTIYFYGFSILIPYIIYGKKTIIKYASFLYGIIFTSAIIIYSLRFMSADYDWQKNTYLISLGLAHFLQSSLPALLLVLAFKLHLGVKVESKK